MKNHIEKIMYSVTLFMLYWITGIVVITSLFFIVGISINYFNVAIPFLLCCIWFLAKEKKRECLWIIGFSLIIVIICVLFAGASYDQTWDGAAYHKQAVGLLKEGWNPIYMSSSYYNTLSESIPSVAPNPLKWAECYPKASWYFAGSIYYYTNNIDSGKAYTLLFIIILFGLSYQCLKEHLNSVWKKIAGAGVIALNPIALDQIQSYYLDGLCGCVLLALMLELVSVIGKEEKDIDNNKKLIIFCLIIWGCNLKFSSLAFTGFICIVYFCYFVKLRWTEWDIIIKKLMEYCGMAVISICVVGYAPYITNIIRYKNPLAGFTDLAFDDANVNIYFGIEGINRYQRTLYSLFGKMSHGTYHSVSELLKIPFTYDKEEILYYSYVDLRIGAFGILFSGIFCVSLILMAIFIVKKHRLFDTKTKLIILFSLLTFIELFAFSTSYQMRYVPHLYFIPIVVYLILLKNINIKEKNIKNIFISGTTIFLTAVILINIFPWIKLIAVRQQEGIKTREELRQMAERQEELTIAFWAYDFNGLHYNLKDNGIKDYKFVDRSELEGDIKTTYGNWVQYY